MEQVQQQQDPQKVIAQMQTVINVLIDQRNEQANKVVDMAVQLQTLKAELDALKPKEGTLE